MEMNELLQSTGNHLSQLQELSIGSTQKTALLPRILQRNPKLKKLRIWDTPLNETESRDLYAALGILSSSSSGEIMYTGSCKMKELELDGLGYLPYLLPPPSGFPLLKRLVILPSRSAASIRSDSTDHIISILFSHCPHLTSVVIPILSDGPILALANSCKLLEELDVVDGSTITDAGLTILSRNCPRLSKVALGSSSLLSDTSIEILIKACGLRLSRLSLPFGSYSLSKSIIYLLMQYAPNLEAITNVSLSRVSFQELSDFVIHMKKLVILGLCIGEPGGIVSPFGYGYLDRSRTDALKKVGRRLKQIIQNG